MVALVSLIGRYHLHCAFCKVILMNRALETWSTFTVSKIIIIKKKKVEPNYYLLQNWPLELEDRKNSRGTTVKLPFSHHYILTF